MDLKTALQTVRNGQQYTYLLQMMFGDKKYTFARGYVLQIFTQKLLETHPSEVREIRRLYNNFLYKNYHPLEYLSLFL
jgi:hypothetical protein